MTTAPRFQIVTELAAFEGWRNCLAVDRRETPPRPVVLSFVPPRIADAPERLARLVEDVERAAPLFHPCILRVVGMETFGDAPVVVQEWRDGESLRELLDTGTRMPPDVAARIVSDACEAVQHSHGRAAEAGRPFAHGALRAERVLIGVDGTAVVSGFGRAAEGDGPVPSAGEDVKALGALLVECLAGEHPSAEGLPGVPDRLAEVAARAAEAAATFESADALRKALAEAVPLASAARVKEWADQVLPPDSGARGRRRRSLVAALVALAEPPIAPPAAPTPAAPPPAAAFVPSPALAKVAAAEVAEAIAASDVVEAPAAAPRAASPTPAPAAIPSPTPAPSRSPVPAPRAAAAPASAPRATALAAEPARAAPVPAAVADDLILGEPPAPRPAARPLEPMPQVGLPRPAPPPGVSWGIVSGVAGAALVVGFSLGFLLGRSPGGVAPAPTAASASPAPSTPAAAPLAPPARAEATPAAVTGAPAPKPAPRRADRPIDAARMGKLDVSAPAGAVILLDGRRIGASAVKGFPVAPGKHVVEVRLDGASASERFEVGPNETWTYNVTPTQP